MTKAGIGDEPGGREPLRPDPVDMRGIPMLADAPGRLLMTSLPGGPRDRGHGPPGRLDEDAATLREVGAHRLVLLVEDTELDRYSTAGIVATMAAHGIVVERHPVPDMGTPSDRPAFLALLDATIERVRAGSTVVVACLGGYGRTGTTVASLLVRAGLTPDDAIARTRACRPGTIERPAQLEFVRSLGWRPVSLRVPPRR
ncbi:MAG TPA: protein-tyrosine phosphatase family protein [Candidatus Saccharimonadales bacterium]|nr:protein-tyrosine phosphatase family protein [Candidatus Saccharimonadales bacterium]